MRRYIEENQRELEQVICNQCGRTLRVEQGILKEGCYEGMHKFGYFSDKDGQEHEFDLCETCYDRMVSAFAVPVTQTDTTELL